MFGGALGGVRAVGLRGLVRHVSFSSCVTGRGRGFLNRRLRCSLDFLIDVVRCEVVSVGEGAVTVVVVVAVVAGLTDGLVDVLVKSGGHDSYVAGAS